MQDALRDLSRPVRLLAAGGTIAMSGERAVPTLDAAQLIGDIPLLGSVADLEAENVLGLPGPQIPQADALRLAQRAVEVAASGAGVVITTGTDTLEELAVLCALLHGTTAPIVLTGANRPAGNPGADGPANLLDAVAVAGSKTAADLGTVVVFGGEIHDAMTVRKTDSTGPAAFGSPVTGPLGRIVDGRIWLHARPARPPAALRPERLTHRVEIVIATLGDDGAQLRDSAQRADGVVVVAFGAGHLTPGMFAALGEAVVSGPVFITCRPERASMLRTTYGFEGAEPDLRASGAICVPFLSPVAARMALLCALGAGLDGGQMAAVLAPWDAA